MQKMFIKIQQVVANVLFTLFLFTLTATDASLLTAPRIHIHTCKLSNHNINSSSGNTLQDTFLTLIKREIQTDDKMQVKGQKII